VPFGRKHQFIVGEILLFHIREGLAINGKVETATLDPIARLGGPKYAKLGEIITMQVVGSGPALDLGSRGVMLCRAMESPESRRAYQLPKDANAPHEGRQPGRHASFPARHEGR
jgi:hypothetical protein